MAPVLTSTQPRTSDTNRAQPQRYALEPDGSFRIERYDTAPAFCSFLPGIAGPDGVPLWCLYVNRAQAVVSFGVQDKDHAIAEYLPATWAYQLVGIQGFRTFCKIDGEYYEPFRAESVGGAPGFDGGSVRTMRIRMDTLELAEVNAPRGLTFTVRYFSPANRPLGSLVRQLTICNVSSKPRRISVLDGLPLVVPAGLTDHGLKTLRHIHEAYAAVRLTCGDVPYYVAKVAAHDEAEVVRLDGGNFYAAWFARRNDFRAVRPLVDPHIVFGAGQDLVTPRGFIGRDALDAGAQVWENRMPCALVPFQAVLEPHESVELFAIAGYTPHERLLAAFLARFGKRAGFEQALTESEQVIDEVVAPCATVTRVPVLDAYTRQNYLDNVLRGGVPVLLPSAAGPTPLYLYARRHGDLERDYNHFVLPRHPLSSGPGNYRDVCQNRRTDVWFYPEVQAQEIRLFVELLQADGYNPLSVDGYRWRLASGAEPAQFCPACDDAARADFARIVQFGFQPGEVLQWAAVHGVALEARNGWLTDLLTHCDRTLVAHGHEGGYWIDHWTYITDLLDAFAGVYPDGVEEMLAGVADLGWFDEGAYVVPRREKYALRAAGPLQVHAVADGTPAPGRLPPTTVLGKLCALVAVKAVSFDYEGRGIEMEAGRPAWNDSLNGLPGLFGSSTCEAAELGRLATWLAEHLPTAPDTRLPVEVADFIEEVNADLAAHAYSWERAAALRETYRARLRQGASGQTRVIRGAVLAQLLDGAARRAHAAIKRSIDPQSGLLHTYYTNTPVLRELAATNGPGDIAAAITRFVPKPLPLYLEGQVHWLRLRSGAARGRAIYEAVRRSPLFDTALQMYKLNECLDGCPPEIGRARTFTRGWFENESIWLHMSYKYLLELVRAGLYEEFFRDARTMLVPFMNPEVYGRSILENSSFLGSSANPDPHTGGELRFRVRPALPGEWFTTAPAKMRHGEQDVAIPADCLACTLLGTVLLVYHNESRKDTFGPGGVRPVRHVLDERDRLEGDSVGSEAARRIRERECRRLDVWLG